LRRASRRTRENRPHPGLLVHAHRYLNRRIRAFIDGWNDRCPPFVRIKTVEQILAKAHRQKTSDAPHSVATVPRAPGDTASVATWGGTVRGESP
jgi:hypothetical protein